MRKNIGFLGGMRDYLEQEILADSLQKGGVQYFCRFFPQNGWI